MRYSENSHEASKAAAACVAASCVRIITARPQICGLGFLFESRGAGGRKRAASLNAVHAALAVAESPVSPSDLFFSRGQRRFNGPRRACMEAEKPDFYRLGRFDCVADSSYTRKAWNAALQDEAIPREP